MLGSLQRVLNYYLFPNGEPWILKIQTRERIITKMEEVNETWSTDGRIMFRQEKGYMIHFNKKQ